MYVCGRTSWLQLEWARRASKKTSNNYRTQLEELLEEQCCNLLLSQCWWLWEPSWTSCRSCAGGLPPQTRWSLSCDIYIYIYICFSLSLYIYICMYVCMYVCVCIYIYIYIYVYTYMFVCVGICMCVCVYICIYIHIHTHTPAPKSSTNILLYPFVLHKCSANYL